MSCRYVPCYSNPCGADCESEFCAAHTGIACCVCGEQATHECNHEGQFVCGARLCDQCEGWNDTSKPRGAWGFLNHNHKRKEAE